MTLWGGRFDDRLTPGLWEFTTDHSDRRLLPDDIAGSIAHVTMLGETAVLRAEEVRSLLAGLTQIRTEAESGSFIFLVEDEDVHSAVERRLGELIGETAGKLHTGRSRNDQVALDLRLYLRRRARERIDQLHRHALMLAELAEEHSTTVVPVYTHLQQAQATSLGHHLLAHAWAALRDAARFGDLIPRLEVSPLGAGAASGSSLALDPESTARHLGMSAVFDNSLDAVGARDHVAEYVFCCVQAMTGLSRLAEEVVLWSSAEFGWLRLGDRVSTGSSALPHKRNPDVAELIRGRTARLTGLMTAILTLQKALPLAYNRDLQEDKRLVFEADDTLGGAIRAMGELLTGSEFSPPSPRPETASLDLAERLVERGVPFREAHRTVGRLLSRLEKEGRDLDSATAEDLAAVDARFRAEDLDALDPAHSLARRRTKGSGSPDSVAEQVARLRSILEHPS